MRSRSLRPIRCPRVRLRRTPAKVAPQSYVLRMGDPHKPLDPVEPAVPRVVKANYEIPEERSGAARHSPTGWRLATIR